MTTSLRRPDATREAESAGPGTGAGTGVGVPWLTVIPLGVVMAYGDGFWVVSLRGAIGAIERTDSPFTGWVRESTLLLPLFAVAVVAALGVSLRRFGPGADGAKSVARTGAVVAASGTVAGLVWLMASEGYDYRLQSAQISSMSAMGKSCDAACLASLQSADLALQVRGVAIGAVLLLVTNLVLVAWVVGLRGGRLPVGTVAPPAMADRVGDWRLILVIGLAGSALIHAAVVPEHLTEWTAAGLFFVLLAVGEAVLAGLVLLSATRHWQLVTLAVVGASIAPLVLWACSRAWGLPFGPEAGVPEAVGVADCAACVLELLTLLAAIVLVRRGRARPERALSAHARALVVLTLVSLTSLGIGGSALPGLHAFGVDAAMTHAAP